MIVVVFSESYAYTARYVHIFVQTAVIRNFYKPLRDSFKAQTDTDQN
jgi:hypothetical protein